MSLKGPGGDCGGAQRDKDPGDLAGDLGRPLRSLEGRGEEGADAGPAWQREGVGAGRWGRATRPGRWSPGRAGRARGPCAGSEGG